ncbi:hypothetical protein ACHAPZ_011498, partial [Fusarium culmorum]
MESSVSIGRIISSLDDAIDTLFNRILKQLAETDVFSKPDAPSLFVVYAHDNAQYGTANSSCVIDLIRWLQDIRSRTVSDRAPLPLLFSRTGGSNSVRNILSNQFCLLPEKDASREDGTIHRVDKVVICGSEVLRRYYHDPFTAPYLEAIKKVYTEGQNQSNPSQAAEQAIRDVVETQCRRSGFHHVITELGLLNLRSSQHKHPNSIIPVTLDQDLMEWLPFRDNCDLVVKLKSPIKAHRHQLFFKLLGQIYSQEHRLINHYKDCYDRASDRLRNESQLSKDMIRQIVDSAISKTQRTLAEVETAALRGRRRHMEKIEGIRSHHETIQSVHQKLTYIADDVKTRLDDEMFTNVANWLSTCSFWLHHQSVSDKVMPGSCAWISNHSKYEDWLHSTTSSTILVQGVRGCGKSSMFSVVVNQLLRQRQKNPNQLSVAYYYCSGAESESDRANPDAILRSILAQTAVDREARAINPIIISEYEQLRKGGNNLIRLGTAGCLQLLQQLTANRTTVIALDGIDELTKPNRAELIQAIERLVEGSQGVIKVLMTSRNDVQTKLLLPSALTVEVSPQLNSQDIENFVDVKLAEAVHSRTLLLGNVSQMLLARIRETLLTGAQEMFLWIELQVELLTRKEAEMDIINALDNGLADNLNRIYDENCKSFHALDHTSKTVVQGLFCWVLYAKCPLTIAALRSVLRLHHELSSHPDEVPLPDLFAVCFNLVVLDAATQTLRFCHPSARVYMRHQAMFSELQGNRLISEACFKQCSNGLGAVPDEVLGLDAINYAALYTGLYWPQHLRASESDDQLPLWLTRPMSCFVLGEDEGELDYDFISWLDWIAGVMSKLPPYHPLKMTHECLSSRGKYSAIFTASVFGLKSLLDLIVDQEISFDLDEESNTGYTPLYLACFFGHSVVATRLLQLGADADIVCGSFGNPLQAACFRGHVDVVEALLKHGVSPKPGAPPFKNALDAACEGSQAGVAYFLVTETSLIETESEYDDALKATTDAGLFEVVEHLMKPAIARRFGRNTIKKEHEQSRVLAMIKKGRADSLRCLLTSEPAMKGNIPQDAMAITALRGHIDMLDYLHSIGIDIEAEGKFGSPLRSASLQGDLRMVRRLLELGSDPTAKCSKGDALQAACSKGHISIVELLIAHGAEVSQQGPPRGSPIQAAAYHGHESVVKLLIEKDARIYCGTYKFKDALHAAVRGGHDEIAAFLQENYPPPPGSILPAIARGDHRDQFWYSEPGAIRQRTRTESPHPEDTDEEDEVQELTDLRDENESTSGADEASQNPLVLASSIGNISTIRQELQAPQVDEESLSKSFEVAAANGKHQAIEVLLDYGLRHVGYPRNPKERGLVASVKYRQPGSFQLLSESLDGTVSVIPWCCALKEAIGAGPGTIMQILDLDIIPWQRDDVEQLAIRLEYDERPAHTNPVLACRATLKDAYSSGQQEAASLIWDWLLPQGPGALKAVHNEWRALLLIAACYADVSVLDRCLALQEECLDSAEVPQQSFTEIMSSSVNGKNDATFNHLLYIARQRSFSSEDIGPVFLQSCLQGYTYAALELSSHDADPRLGDGGIIQGIVAASAAGHETLALSLMNNLEDEKNIVKAIENTLLSAAGGGKTEVIAGILRDTDIQSHDAFEAIMSRVLVTACELEHLDVVQMCLDEGAEAEAILVKAPPSVVPNLYDPMSQLWPYLLAARQTWRPTPLVHRYALPPQASFAGLNMWNQADIDYLEYSVGDALQASILAFKRILRSEKEPGFDLELGTWKSRAKKQLKVVSLILEYTCNLGDRDSRRSDHPLRIAVEFGTDEVVKALLDKGGADRFSSGQLKALILMAAGRQVLIGVRIILQLLACDRQLSLPTEEDGLLNSTILESLELIVDRNDHVLSKKGKITSETSARDLMNGGLQQLVNTIFRKLPGESAEDDAFGAILHMAAAAGDMATVRLLIKHRVNVNHKRYRYHTALGAAAKFGQCQIIKALVRAKANIHPKGKTDSIFGNQEPAIKAILGGQVPALKTLVDLGLDPNVYAGDVPLLVFAAQSKIAAMVKILLETGSRPHEHPLAMVTAAHAGDLETMTHLLDAGANPNTFAIYGDTILEQLLCSPLYIACKHGQTEAVNMLLERGADANIDSGDRDGLPLVVAARIGHMAIVKALLAKGCDPTARSQGLDALSLSDQNKFLPVLRNRDFQLYQGAPVSHGLSSEPAAKSGSASHERVENSFLHALESACDVEHGFRASLQTVKVLSEAIHDPQKKQEACFEALQHVSKTKNTRLFEELVDFVTIDLSVLELACRCGSVEAVKKIMDQGINSMTANQDGKVPLEVSVEYENMELTEFLVADRMLFESQQEDTLSLNLYYLVTSILEAYAWSTLAKHKSITRCEETVERILATAKDSQPVVPADQQDLDRSLFLACHIGSVKIATMLLQLGARPETRADLTQHSPAYISSPLLASITNNHPSVLKVLLEWLSERTDGNKRSSWLDEAFQACLGNLSPVLLQTILDFAGPFEILDHHLVLAVQRETWNRSFGEADVQVILEHRPDLKPSEKVLITLAKAEAEFGLLHEARLRTLWACLIARGDCGVTKGLIQAISDTKTWQILHACYQVLEGAHGQGAGKDEEIESEFEAIWRK